MIYYCILIVLFFVSFLEVMAYSKNLIIHEKWLAVFFVFVMIVLAGGRSAIGNDYYSYQELFVEIHNGAILLMNDTYEVGYCLLNKILPSYRTLLFVVAFLAVFLKYRAFLKQHIGYVCVMLLFYYMSFFLYYDMGIIRQGISLAICFLSLDSIIKRRKRFFGYIIVACCFHLTAMFFIPLWFVGNREFSKRTYIIVLSGAILLGTSNYFIGDYIGRIINVIGGAYIKHKFIANTMFEESEVLPTIVRRVVLSLLFIYQYKRKDLYIGNIVIKSRIKDEKIRL